MIKTVRAEKRAQLSIAANNDDVRGEIFIS
jgi:hypothetical protein